MGKTFVVVGLSLLIFASGCRQLGLLNFAANEKKETASTQRVQLPLRPNSRLVKSVQPTEKNPATVEPVAKDVANDESTFVAERIAKLQQPPKKVDIGVPPPLPKVESATEHDVADNVQWLTVGDAQGSTISIASSAAETPSQPQKEAKSQPLAPVEHENSSSTSDSAKKIETASEREQPHSPSDTKPTDPFANAYAELKSGNEPLQIAACETLRASGSPELIPHLTPLLQDNNPNVVIACLQALAACGPWVDPKPLEKVLIEGDQPVQKAAIIALCELGSPIGPAAIEQMSHSLNPVFRSTAAQCAGELADPLFIPMLIRLLDDPTQARQAALNALPTCSGVNLSPADTLARSAAKWRQWYLSGGRNRAE